MSEPVHLAIEEQLEDGTLPCTRAFAVAKQLGVEPLAVGQAANDLGIRISRCQLGLFGYGPKAEGKHKIVHPADSVPEHLAALLRAGSQDGGILCAAVWQTAGEVGVSRLEAAACAEAMGLHVSICQLGCFPRAAKG